ncbi:futalosine hydrolase [Streptomyces sp. 891-h]|uniref:futalosine hydrolase n=1 Tax=Streptomyces sp. 891-h TaxID=2720714 RepID=UPI001FA9BA16|nr:futalosine hydrolase [Streptomyces sp. 891-h]UNZ18707.1 futalosine hydrolase [Streptomyces sp. 891-h]
MLSAYRRVLVVAAVAAEREAVVAAAERTRAPHLDVVAAGVGPAAAAAATATALVTAAHQARPYDLVIATGISGGFAASGVHVGDTVVADRIVAADLGAETPAGFASVTELGFGHAEHTPPPHLVRAVAEATGARTGPVLSVSTTTGTQEHAEQLLARHPDAAAEAMEGFGVAEAARAHSAELPVLELRTVSNAVGPRDRAAWRIPEALAALTTAFGKLVPQQHTEGLPS